MRKHQCGAAAMRTVSVAASCCADRCPRSLSSTWTASIHARTFSTSIPKKYNSPTAASAWMLDRNALRDTASWASTSAWVCCRNNGPPSSFTDTKASSMFTNEIIGIYAPPTTTLFSTCSRSIARTDHSARVLIQSKAAANVLKLGTSVGIYSVTRRYDMLVVQVQSSPCK